ncbi:glutamate receptor ionotropic, delta-2 [Leguminivora glycinivorella]|uniref:glutamate receptor ionotropic, delta-2 n=1 Tax=Leguminivora glycinivorella TaxID=1035111 RepID=UPI00200C4F42|nr:glutamate receptor ionotropic, delta-2 [Leguminivora glycinivorella]
MMRGVESRKDLEWVLVDLLNAAARRGGVTCAAVVCDAAHLGVWRGALWRRLSPPLPVVMIVVEEYEDLLSPNFDTLEALRQARKDGCNVYVILLANGLQAARLLRFGDRHRILDTRAAYIMLHDYRLFTRELHYVWKRVVNVVFVRRHAGGTAGRGGPWVELSTVPFPNPIRAVFVSRRLDIWRNGRFHYNRPLFADKTRNLNAEVLNVVYLDHVPSVVVSKHNDTNKIGGVEIEILNTLAEKMNFKPNLYQSVNAEYHKWGQKQANGSFSGLIGEIVSGADVALGNLQYTPYHLALMDLGLPYTAQCFTFLTPEALTDNSWKTLILPFKLYMWIAVLLVLLMTGAIFHGLARCYGHLLRYQREHYVLTDKHDHDREPAGLYLFGSVANSILYTYGMLVVVSLPRLPGGGAVRLLTGAYWLYCILLGVSYRASMTAILANPAPTVTIDTLQELVDSGLVCGGWGAETERFFDESLDEIGQRIGERFQTIDDPDEAAAKVARGVFAYYENEYYLKYLSVKRKNWDVSMETQNATNASSVKVAGDRDLHIMSDCVVNIPISLGFHKNSPLKPLADEYTRRAVEVGLVGKWLGDAMAPLRARDSADNELKALMNLNKLYGAFIALAIGYFLSFVCLFGELIYWNCVVKKDPNFDKYAMDLYYVKKK